MQHSTQASSGIPLSIAGISNPDPRDHPAIARVLVDGTGSITSMSAGARKLLGYGEAARFDPCFFAHINSRNLLQVMRDVASMVCRGRTTAQWIVRMRTADRDWIWLRLVARKLQAENSADEWIAVDLERVGA